MGDRKAADLLSLLSVRAGPCYMLPTFPTGLLQLGVVRGYPGVFAVFRGVAVGAGMISPGGGSEQTSLLSTTSEREAVMRGSLASSPRQLIGPKEMATSYTRGHFN